MRRYDPILLTKIARIYAEHDAVSMQALNGEVEQDFKVVGEKPQIIALVNEFGRDAVLAALIDVQKVRIATCNKVLDLHRLLKDMSSDQVAPSSGAVVLVKKVFQIFREGDVVFVARVPVDGSHPKIAALMNEYDRDLVLDTLAEVTKIWKEVYEKGSDIAIEAGRDPDLRLN